MSRSAACPSLVALATLWLANAGCGLILDLEDDAPPDAASADAGPADGDADAGADAEPDAAVPDAGDALCEPSSCPSIVVTSTIGALDRDFATMGAWEATRQGDLAGRHVVSVRPGSGRFQAGEPVAGPSGCIGTYVPSDDANTNGPVMSLDGFSGTCAPGEVLRGATSEAEATYLGHRGVGTVERGEAYADAVFAENVVIDGSITDAEHYMWLTVAPGHRHRGVAGTGVVIRPPTAGHGVLMADAHTILEWVEVTEWSFESAGSFDGVNIIADQVLVEHVLVHGDGHGSIANSDANGITLEGDGLTATVRNSIIYDVARTGVAIHEVNGATLFVINTTVHRCTVADNLPTWYGCIALTHAPDSILHVMNSIGTDPRNGALAFQVRDGAWGEVRGNLSSDGTAPGAGSIRDVADTAQYVSLAEGAVDLHLAPESDARGAGVALAEGAVDIDGQERPPAPAPWDIGADHYVP